MASPPYMLFWLEYLGEHPSNATNSTKATNPTDPTNTHPADLAYGLNMHTRTPHVHTKRSLLRREDHQQGGLRDRELRQGVGHEGWRRSFHGVPNSPI
jgi:hypothetical protein